MIGSRTSRVGQKVCILERGQERWPGEYPNTFGTLMENAQVRSAVAPQLGSRDAFFDFRLEDGVYIWIGCGLGGGSLVNSGVSIAPDPRVFDDPRWPKEIQADKETKLKDGFDRAEAVLRPAQYPHQETKPLPRVERFQEAAAHLRKNGYPAAKAELAHVNVSFDAMSPNPQNVEQPACTNCGDCNTGCNVGAKNTVLMNYLPDASQHGADIFTQVEVLYVSKSEKKISREDEKDEEPLWDVHCILVGADNPKPNLAFTVTTKLLVLAAGTLGSTEILLRSRDQGNLSMSSKIGASFGADGDFFRPSFNGESKTNTLGYGDDKDGARRAAEDDSVGPCITSVLDLRDPTAPVDQGIILEDIGIGGALCEATNKIFSTLADVAGQPTEMDPKKLEEAKVREENSSKNPWASDGALVTSVMWGGMSFDDQQGSMVLDDDALRIKWATAATGGPNPPARSDALAKACCETPTIKSVFCTDPLESMFGSRGSIHPLGGCCLGDSAETGGCNHKGQLFSSGVGSDVHTVREEHHFYTFFSFSYYITITVQLFFSYFFFFLLQICHLKKKKKNLYVCDGSVIPTSLGVNPLWTISAVAERCAAYMAEDRGWKTVVSEGGDDGGGENLEW